jgi:hypothetical protein
MKPIKFTTPGDGHAYKCSEPGDQSGEYIRVERLIFKLKEEIDKTPSDKHGLAHSDLTSYMSGFEDGFVKSLEKLIEVLEVAK